MRARLAVFAALFLSLALLTGARAQDPSLPQVYQAVHEGRLHDAQAMMTKVLRDHPDSAKAHYVEAEVLVRLDRAAEARSELARAENLAPGLPFAKPDAVSDLRGLIAERSRTSSMGAERPTVASDSHADSGFPWGIVLIIAGAGIVLFLFLRARSSTVVAAPGMAMGPGGAGYGAPGYPYGGGPMGGGIGSGIVGGLATGVAVGAGVVAGEALAHEFIGNHDRDRLGNNDGSWTSTDDAGGRNFGVSGSDSWDSGGSGGDISGGDGGGGGDWG